MSKEGDASDRIRRQLARTGDASTLPVDAIAELDIELACIIQRMSARPTFEDSAPEMNELSELHELMALLLFKYRVELSERQEHVVEVLDRWDDEDTRRRFYEEVVAGRI